MRGVYAFINAMASEYLLSGHDPSQWINHRVNVNRIRRLIADPAYRPTDVPRKNLRIIRTTGIVPHEYVILSTSLARVKGDNKL